MSQFWTFHARNPTQNIAKFIYWQSFASAESLPLNRFTLDRRQISIATANQASQPHWCIVVGLPPSPPPYTPSSRHEKFNESFNGFNPSFNQIHITRHVLPPTDLGFILHIVASTHVPS